MRYSKEIEICEGVNIHVKTIEGWNKFALETGKTSWGQYCLPGELISDDVYDYFLNILPPISMRDGYMQVGEPSDCMLNPEDGKYHTTYPTFERYLIISHGNAIWRYCGDCFYGKRKDAGTYKAYGSITEFLSETYSLKFGAQEVRHSVMCNDGFSMSVQAGKYFQCSPADDLKNGEYQTCEVGNPTYNDPLLLPYIESKDEKPEESIYPFVPVKIIDEIIKNHGGWFVSKGVPIV